MGNAIDSGDVGTAKECRALVRTDEVACRALLLYSQGSAVPHHLTEAIKDHGRSRTVPSTGASTKRREDAVDR